MATRVLVVDDEADVRDAWERGLRLAGFHVTKASDAASALTLCTKQTFDIVVLDFIMPSMSGLELLRRVRVHYPLIRSIIVSGKLDDTVSEKDITDKLKQSVEADVYLHKPLENEKLIEVVRALAAGAAKGTDWKEIAARSLKAQKRQADVKATERELKSMKKAKKPPETP